MTKKKFQPEGKRRSEVKKHSKNVRCILLNGSGWSTERKYMKRYTGTFDILFGAEHATRKEEMEEQFNKEAA